MVRRGGLSRSRLSRNNINSSSRDVAIASASGGGVVRQRPDGTTYIDRETSVTQARKEAKSGGGRATRNIYNASGEVIGVEDVFSGVSREPTAQEKLLQRRTAGSPRTVSLTKRQSTLEAPETQNIDTRNAPGVVRTITGTTLTAIKTFSFKPFKQLPGNLREVGRARLEKEVPYYQQEPYRLRGTINTNQPTTETFRDKRNRLLLESGLMPNAPKEVQQSIAVQRLATNITATAQGDLNAKYRTRFDELQRQLDAGEIDQLTAETQLQIAQTELTNEAEARAKEQFGAESLAVLDRTSREYDSIVSRSGGINAGKRSGAYVADIAPQLVEPALVIGGSFVAPAATGTYLLAKGGVNLNRAIGGKSYSASERTLFAATAALDITGGSFGIRSGFTKRLNSLTQGTIEDFSRTQEKVYGIGLQNYKQGSDLTVFGSGIRETPYVSNVRGFTSNFKYIKGGAKRITTIDNEFTYFDFATNTNKKISSSFLESGIVRSRTIPRFIGTGGPKGITQTVSMGKADLSETSGIISSRYKTPTAIKQYEGISTQEVLKGKFADLYTFRASNTRQFGNRPDSIGSIFVLKTAQRATGTEGIIGGSNGGNVLRTRVRQALTKRSAQIALPQTFTAPTLKTPSRFPTVRTLLRRETKTKTEQVSARVGQVAVQERKLSQLGFSLGGVTTIQRGSTKQRTFGGSASLLSPGLLDLGLEKEAFALSTSTAQIQAPKLSTRTRTRLRSPGLSFGGGFRTPPPSFNFGGFGDGFGFGGFGRSPKGLGEFGGWGKRRAKGSRKSKYTGSLGLYLLGFKPRKVSAKKLKELDLGVYTGLEARELVSL